MKQPELILNLSYAIADLIDEGKAEESDALSTEDLTNLKECSELFNFLIGFFFYVGLTLEPFDRNVVLLGDLVEVIAVRPILSAFPHGDRRGIRKSKASCELGLCSMNVLAVRLFGYE